MPYRDAGCDHEERAHLGSVVEREGKPEDPIAALRAEHVNSFFGELERRWPADDEEVSQAEHERARERTCIQALGAVSSQPAIHAVQGGSSKLKQEQEGSLSLG